ncbi:hypothetical protein C0991_007473 [Blastosporella zonata]|nr:hypothetical protein C0991_007473 [Blastosporella zonata]
MTSDSLPKAKPDLTSTRKPKSPLAIFIWRRRMWFESTFVLSMLEPWEKVLLVTLFFMSFVLVMTGIFKYLPEHVSLMLRRAMYYLWGQEGDERIFWQWLGLGVSVSSGPSSGWYKEL